MPQGFYLLFLYAKRPVCSRVPEFAAYFRAAIPEVRGKTEIGRPEAGFTLPRPAVLLAKIRLCSEVSDFFPALPKKRGKTEHPKARNAPNASGQTSP